MSCHFTFYLGLRILCAQAVVSIAILVTTSVASQTLAVDPQLGESVVLIKNNRFFSVDLETTIFRPAGEGPFPVVMLHHGKDLGDARFQSRARHLPATREFLQRGYAVVAPMRQGFSKSGGAVVGEGCNIAGNGEAQAEDIRAVVSWLEKQPWADTQRMVMMGQSHGGLTTLAYAQDPHPGFKLFVNFAGGLKWASGGCPWERELANAFRRYGANTKVPSLWFYGANDSYFPPQVIQPAFEAYVASGGAAQLVAFGPFGADAHGMFGSFSGLPIWVEKVEIGLAAAGLPTRLINPQYARRTPAVIPASGFAKIDEIHRLPFLKERGREGFKTFLTKSSPRAFALAPNGAWAWAEGGEDPQKSALDNCSKHAPNQCRLYAVDQDVVWTEKNP